MALPVALAAIAGAWVLVVRDDHAQRAAFEGNLTSVVLAMINDFQRISLLKEQTAGVEVVERLRAFGAIRRLYVRDRDGGLMFSYARPGSPQTPPPGNPDLRQYGGDHVWLDVPLVVHGASMGNALVQSDLKQFRAERGGRIRRMIAATAALFGAATIVALLVGGALARPVTRITAFVTEASQTLDTTRRLDESDGGEIGRLTAAINRFLEALQRRRDAEAANRAKSEFLANMSHEIRTPLTAILGYADLMLLPNQPADEHARCIQVIRQNGEHLLEVINEILDLSKIEAGKMTVESIECSPLEIVEEVRSFMAVRAAEKGVRLQVDYGFPLPARVRSDPLRLRQILINLAANAIKFSKTRVTIRLTLESCVEGGAGRLRCEVTDDGIGMTPAQIERLFQPFVQAEASTARQFGGTGLGLTISRRLVALLSGTMEVESAVGSGSAFSLTFPVASSDLERLVHERPTADRKAGQSTTRFAPDHLAGIRVLVAEDNPVNQHLVRRLLECAGAQVEAVGNGRLAVERALNADAEGRPFGVVLMDMQMPVMNGYAATSELRERGYAGAILALTAHAMSGDREKCMSCGCNAYLSKPIRRDNLYSLVHDYGGATRERAVASSRA